MSSAGLSTSALYFERKRQEYISAPFNNELESIEYSVPLSDWAKYHATRPKDEALYSSLEDIVAQCLTGPTIVAAEKKIILSPIHIEKMGVDAIVNAANETLLGGGGVDEAIHKAAGPNLVRECATLKGCEVAEAKVTKGYALPAPYVIHTVAPIYDEDGHPQPKPLLECYENSLKLAERLGLTSIAFPCLGCGFYGFPVETSAAIVIPFIATYLKETEGSLTSVVLSLFDETQKTAYSTRLAAL